MNTDKAYLLGLIIGGGIFGNAEDVFRIRLPYRKWGSYLDNPQRAGQIAGDILRKVGNMFRAVYNLTVQYEATPGGNWVILCEGDITPVKEDLEHYNIVCEGEIRSNANLTNIIPDLVDDNLKRRFIAGLADTIGSMARSQRRFSDEHQILSFEINGYNYKFVCDLCNLLYSINCIPDQVNWNHPNIHCPSDPYYTQWSKGFKLRILLDQYARFGAFAFRTKAETATENRKLQQETHSAGKCEERELHATSSTIHPAENDLRLPEVIRGGHYIHFRHFCAVLGCPHAPFEKVAACFTNIGDLITPFPILCKANRDVILQRINSDELLRNRTYNVFNFRVSSLLEIFSQDQFHLLYGSKANNGYPITEIMKAVAFIIANPDELMGNRPRGGYIDVIKKHLDTTPNLEVEFHKPDLLTPLIIIGQERAAMIGSKNPDVYKKLFTFDENNRFKVLTRQITEEDLRNE